MRIPKLLLTVCAMSVCAGFISARAEDTPEQAAARATLETKLHEMNAQNEVGGASLAATNSADTEATAKAQAAVEQKISELNQPQSTQNPPVIYVPELPQTNGFDAEDALHKKMDELNAQEKSGMVFVPVAPQTPQASPEAQANARAALEQRMSQLNQQEMAAQKPATNETAATVVTQPPPPPAPTPPPPAAPADVSYPGKDLGLKPIEAPAMPVSADIEAQLQALDAKYMANQISPEEYHKRRAEILAGQ
jgi:hypothetical protein